MTGRRAPAPRYDSSGRVTAQTDPMGYQTTFNYCVNSTAGDCLNTATGTGYVTVTDPDGNTTIDYYIQGTQAAQTTLTGGTVTSETDEQPDTTSGTLLDTSSTDGNGNTTSNTIDTLGNTTQTVAPAGATTSGFAEQNYATEGEADCTTTATTMRAC